MSDLTTPTKSQHSITIDPPLIVEIESLALPIHDFYETRNKLIAEGKQFDPISLMSVPYGQLYLCCISNAGTAMCDSALVAAERRNRRTRFLTMDAEQLKECDSLLHTERMLEDVKWCRESNSITPTKWSECNERQQAWFKVNCVINHTDSPMNRLAEAIDLLKQAAFNHDLPNDVVFSLIARIRAAVSALAQGITEQQFRERIIQIADTIYYFLPENERLFCGKEELRDYSCTSNCYRVNC
jgi:hypothetical protein